MSWLGGAADFITGGFTDFDNKGSQGGFNWIPFTDNRQFKPIGSGSDGRWGPSIGTQVGNLPSIGSQVGGALGGYLNPSFSASDAFEAFAKGYAGGRNVSASNPTSSGSAFANDYYRNMQSNTPQITGLNQGSQGGVSFKNIAVLPGNWNTPSPYVLPDIKDPYSPSMQGGSGSAPKKDKFGDFLGKASQVVSIIGALGAACDIRIKEDIAPLITTEVNDELAEVAFFVKGLRECS